MTNTFGNTVNINVGCATVPFRAPQTGSTTTASLVLASLTVLGFATYKRGKFAAMAKLTGFAKS
jgi:LPXTG-motif cell wall-anchored protein